MRDQAPGFYTPLALVSQDGHNDFCAPGTDPYPSNHSELFLRCMALASFRPLTVLEFEFPHKLHNDLCAPGTDPILAIIYLC